MFLICFIRFIHHHIHQRFGQIELEIVLIELGIGLRINNARHTVFVQVSGLVSFLSAYFYQGAFI